MPILNITCARCRKAVVTWIEYDGMPFCPACRRFMTVLNAILRLTPEQQDELAGLLRKIKQGGTLAKALRGE